MNNNHQLVVSISKSILQGFYFQKGEPVHISISGNKEIRYKSDSDFDKLISSIVSTFSVGELSDLNDMSVIIINADADSELTDQLFDKFRDIPTHSLVRAENVIPYILASKGQLHKNKSLNVSVFDSSFLVQYCEETVECIPGQDKSLEDICLTASDFLTLFKANPDKIGVDEGELSVLKNKIDILQKDLKTLTDENKQLQLTSINLNKELEETKRKNEQDTIVKSLHPACLSAFFDFDISKNSQSNRDFYVYFAYEPLCESGSAVEEGQEIATIKAFTFVDGCISGELIRVHVFNVVSILNGYIYFKDKNEDFKVTKIKHNDENRSYAYGEIYCAISECRIEDKSFICWAKLEEQKELIEKMYNTPYDKALLYRRNGELIKSLGVDPVVCVLSSEDELFSQMFRGISSRPSYVDLVKDYLPSEDSLGFSKKHHEKYEKRIKKFFNEYPFTCVPQLEPKI